MLKLKLQYFGHMMSRANSLKKTPSLGKVECKRKRGRQRMKCLDGTTDSMDMSLSKLWERVKDSDTWGCKDSDTTYQLNNKTELISETPEQPGNICFQRAKHPLPTQDLTHHIGIACAMFWASHHLTATWPWKEALTAHRTPRAWTAPDMRGTQEVFVNWIKKKETKNVSPLVHSQV